MMIAWLDRWISSLSQNRVLALAGFFCVGIFVSDVLTPPSVQISIFYIIPVMMLSWYVSRTAGMVGAVFCAVLGALPHFLRSAPEDPLLFPLGWKFCAHLVLFGTIVLILDVVMSKLTKIQSLAERDLLTGALNKVAFTERLHQQLHLARRADWPLTLAYVDIDHFKRINDTLGHDQGDKALKIVSDVMHETVRCTDTVGRLGGDEFALILQNAGSDAAGAIMFALRLSLQNHFAQWSIPVTCSTGAVTFIDPPGDARVALRAADTLMYQAKREGRDRNCFKLVHPALHYYRDKAQRAFTRTRESEPRIGGPLCSPEASPDAQSV